MGMTTTFEVKRYEVQLGRAMELANSTFHALIACTGSDGDRLLIYFLCPDSKPLPNLYIPSRKLGRIVAPAAHFPWYVETLRNEAPIYAYMSTDKPDSNHIRTGREPVGEEES